MKGVTGHNPYILEKAYFKNFEQSQTEFNEVQMEEGQRADRSRKMGNCQKEIPDTTIAYHPDE